MKKNLLFGLKDIFAVANGERIVGSFIDTDHYKFPMGYFIWKNPEYRDADVTFELIVRDKRINLSKVIPEGALREQLDECMLLSLTQAGSSFIGGMTMSDNKTVIIPGDYLAELRKVKLPKYDLRFEKGDYKLRFRGPYWMVTWWEIFGMEIISELYYYYLIKKFKLSDFEIMTIYSKMISKLHEKIELLKTIPELTFTLFDCRRRHSRYLQELIMWIMRAEIPNQCIGSSSVALSMKHGTSNSFGTNAHELQMMKVCLAGDDVEKILSAPFDIVDEWWQTFGYDLSIILPDAYGTGYFVKNAPKRMAIDHKGARPDSMEQTAATDLFVKWWEKNGVDPKTKIILPSDGLDAPDMVRGYKENAHKVGLYTFGWGTLASNDCRGVWPRSDGFDLFRPFSMACKLVEVNGVPAVKITDNPDKGTGDLKRRKKIMDIFGVEGLKRRDVIV